MFNNRQEKNILKLMNALADQTRLGVVLFLRGGERCVCEIFEHLNLPQNLVSHHLRVLRQAGLIQNRRDGWWVWYSLNDKKFKELDCCFRRLGAPKKKKIKHKHKNK